MKRDILYSSDKKIHRYKLKYTWDESLPTIMFIMLNPSYTRPEGKYSTTSVSIIEYAKKNGYGSVYVGNLFSFITPVPVNLQDQSLFIAIGNDNDKYLKEMADESSKIIFAWGKFPFAYDRAEIIKKLFPEGIVLFTNDDGSPCHPRSHTFKNGI